MSKGLVETRYVVEIDNDKVRRRVYEDWNGYVKGKERDLVFFVKGTRHLVTMKEIEEGMKEATRRWDDLFG